MTMDLEEALRTAIEFEKKVYQVYDEAADKIGDPVGRRVFRRLAVEEAEHVAYLKHRLDEWRSGGRIRIERLETAVPDRERIEQESRSLVGKLERVRPEATEVAYLKSAFEAEKETSAFYRRMVGELPGQGQELFARFVEIEQGHVAIVQAEIDAVEGTGFWFDMMEFDLEAG